MHTKNAFTLASLLLASVVAFAQVSNPVASTAEDVVGQNEPPMFGIYWAKDGSADLANEAARIGTAGTSPNMIYHGGKIMKSVVAETIFWGKNWGSSTFVKDKITGLDKWHVGFSGSNYAKTSDEYTGSNGTVGPSLSYQGHVIDTTAATGSSTGTIIKEVCKVVAHPVSNGYYPVYVDLKRGGAQFCAYHSKTSCGGVQVQFAFFFNLDGDRGCDPQDTSGLHSQGLSALANVSGHELSEARTDPVLNAWFDSQGFENGDKCAWTFNVPLVKFSDGNRWKIQGEWSNKAFNAKTGYPNSLGQKGCLDGH